MIKSVEYPPHIRHGIKPLLRSVSLKGNVRIFGADTESCAGEPISLQIDSGDDWFFCWTDRDRIFSDFWTWIMPRCRPKGVNVCYFHNLSFDMRMLFARWHFEMYEQRGDAEFSAGKAKVKMLYGKVNKADVSEGAVKLSIYDSKAFTQSPFAKSLKMFAIPQEKLQEPEDLGRVDYARLTDSDPRKIAFLAYANQDAKAEHALGAKIIDFHAAYNINPCLSLPSYAAKVFRSKFMRPDEIIPFPPDPVAKAAELSYHGGKNGLYVKTRSVVEDVYEVDINSAYPYAMRELPGLTSGKYFSVDEYDPDHEGLYKLSGEVVGGHYPLVFDHGFKKVAGSFEDLWHTSYETGRILAEHRHIRIKKLKGYVWEPDPGAVNPFKRFVDYFYEKKENTPKTDAWYSLYKICMNALYGKTIASVEIHSEESDTAVHELIERGIDIPECVRIDERYDPVLKRNVSIRKKWRAGGFYSPLIGSWITGHTRRYLYDLEVRLQALHSATDSVKTLTEVPAVKGLGGVKVECFGRCYLFRNKLYLHFSKDYRYCGHDKAPHDGFPFKYPRKYLDGSPHPKAGKPLVDRDGQHLCKVALHGYKGPLWVLFENRDRLIRTGKMAYDYMHVVGLREGLRRGFKPGDFKVIPGEELDLTSEGKIEYDQQHNLDSAVDLSR